MNQIKVQQTCFVGHIVMGHLLIGKNNMVSCQFTCTEVHFGKSSGNLIISNIIKPGLINPPRLFKWGGVPFNYQMMTIGLTLFSFETPTSENCEPLHFFTMAWSHWWKARLERSPACHQRGPPQSKPFGWSPRTLATPPWNIGAFNGRIGSGLTNYGWWMNKWILQVWLAEAILWYQQHVGM